MEGAAAQTRREEYQALRRFIKLASLPEGGSARRLREVMERELTPRQLEFMRLYYIEQRGMRDIAREQGIAASTVSRTIMRGRRRLRVALRYGGGPLLRALEED